MSIPQGQSAVVVGTGVAQPEAVAPGTSHWYVKFGGVVVGSNTTPFSPNGWNVTSTVNGGVTILPGGSPITPATSNLTVSVPIGATIGAGYEVGFCVQASVSSGWAFPFVFYVGSFDVVAAGGGGGTPPPTVVFTASPSDVCPSGGAAGVINLQWTSTNATGVTVVDDLGNTVGSGLTGNIFVIIARTTVWTATATGAGGTATATAQVNVWSPVGCSLTATPNAVVAGDAVDLHIFSMNGSTAGIDNGIGQVPLNGNITVHPSVTTVYTLTVANAGGCSCTSQARVNIVSLTKKCKPDAGTGSGIKTRTSR